MTTKITFVTEEGYSARISPGAVWTEGDVRWNGYIRVPKGHPLFGMSYGEAEDEYDIQVHGGLTYSEQEGEVWAFGFDTCHSFDGKFGEENYRDPDYVKDECKKLSQQLAEIEKK